MVAAVFDTNILIDHLNGVEQARAEIRSFARKQISIVTWMEVLVGVTDDNEAKTRGFLRQFDVLAIDQPVAERAVEIRRNHRIKLPDALIWRRLKRTLRSSSRETARIFPPTIQEFACPITGDGRSMMNYRYDACAPTRVVVSAA